MWHYVVLKLIFYAHITSVISFLPLFPCLYLLIWLPVVSFNQKQTAFEQLLIKQKSVFDLLWVFKRQSLFQHCDLLCCHVGGCKIQKPTHLG